MQKCFQILFSRTEYFLEKKIIENLLGHLVIHNSQCFVLISASLLHVYDDSWQVDSFPSLIGSNHFSNINSKASIENNEAPAAVVTEANAEPVAYKPNKKDITELKRYLTLMGVGYLIPGGTKIQDPKKFTHLCSTIMDKIGNSLYAHCLNITQNVAFEFLNFGIFHQFLSY